MRDRSVIDLFCGCGGLSQGFAQAVDESGKSAFRVAGGLDAWSRALDVYGENVKAPARLADLSDPDSSVAQIDDLVGGAPFAILGGPPCQDFSSAGKREHADRASLTDAYGEIVMRLRPDWLVMENVPEVTGYAKFHPLVEQFRSLYTIGYRVMDASRLGVPQSRKRLFMIGFRSDLVCDTVEDAAGAREAVLADLWNSLLPSGGPAVPRMTLAEYIKGNNRAEKLFPHTYYYRHPRNYTRRGIFSIHETAPTVRGAIRPMPSSYKRHPGDPDEETVPREEVMDLAPEHLALMQTFPANWNWDRSKIPKSDARKMIGNAVPVKMAEAVARAVWRQDRLLAALRPRPFPLSEAQLDEVTRCAEVRQGSLF